ncbi:nucleotidyltransferase domain-containing protein [Candidatus Woesearchaeota archaeon]|nr:nucleotidyltransferase domain-containing protein [Candidatus Woesearchaeota archaeon]
MKTYNIKEKIKEYFFMNPTAKLRVRQIEREMNLPLPSVIRYCKELEKEEILKKESISGVSAYSADRASKKFLLAKRLFNIKLIFESGLMDYIVKGYFNPVIVLFGSYSKGEDIEDSDIDLYIETQKKQDFNLKKFEKILHRRIQIFNFRNIREVSNHHLSNNIINGITLNNFLEAFR